MWRQTGSLSPLPFVVSHDTFIKGGGHQSVGVGGNAMPAARPELRKVITPAEPENKLPPPTIVNKEAVRPVAATRKTEVAGRRLPSMQGEPPTPPIGRIAPQTLTSQPQKKTQTQPRRPISGGGGEAGDDEPRTKTARLEAREAGSSIGHNTEDMEEDDDSRFPVQEERLPAKFRRRPSKTIQPRRESSDSGDAAVASRRTKILTEEQLELAALSAEDRQVVERDDLSDKERSVITEVLMARRSRSRSSSRMSVSPVPPPPAVDSTADQILQAESDDGAGQRAADTSNDIVAATKGTSGLFTKPSSSGINKSGRKSDSREEEEEGGGSSSDVTGGGKMSAAAEQPKIDKQASPLSASRDKSPSLATEGREIEPEDKRLSAEINRVRDEIDLESLLPIKVENIADLTLDQVMEHLIQEEEGATADEGCCAEPTAAEGTAGPGAPESKATEVAAAKAAAAEAAARKAADEEVTEIKAAEAAQRKAAEAAAAQRKAAEVAAVERKAAEAAATERKAAEAAAIERKTAEAAAAERKAAEAAAAERKAADAAAAERKEAEAAATERKAAEASAAERKAAEAAAIERKKAEAAAAERKAAEAAEEGAAERRKADEAVAEATAAAERKAAEAAAIERQAAEAAERRAAKIVTADAKTFKGAAADIKPFTETAPLPTARKNLAKSRYEKSEEKEEGGSEPSACPPPHKTSRRAKVQAGGSDSGGASPEEPVRAGRKHLAAGKNSCCVLL